MKHRPAATIAVVGTLAATLALLDPKPAAATDDPLCVPDTSRPLVCTLYDTGRTTGAPKRTGLLAADTIPASWPNTAYLLLGEVHDNPAHHAIRARIVGTLASGERRVAAVAFEQLRADVQPALDTFRASGGSTDDFLRAVGWEKSPWSKTSDYRPLFDTVVAARLPILAADPAREAIRKAAKEGLAAALPASDRSRLGLDTLLGQANDAASLAEIEASHCGAIPKEAHAGMAEAQRYRDAHQADVLIGAAGTGTNAPVILIAGNGHVRADRGVPWYLRLRTPDKPSVAVLFLEAEDGNDDPAAYVERGSDGKPTADFIVFTTKAQRAGDPCEGMRKGK